MMFSVKSIRLKIVSSFALVIFLSTILAFFLVNYINNTNKIFGQFVSQETLHIITLLEIKNASNAVQSGVAQFQLLDKTDTHFEGSPASQVKFSLLAAIAKMKSLQTEYRQYISNDDTADLTFLEELVSEEDHLIQLALKLFELRERDINDAAIPEMTKELIEAGNSIEDHIDGFLIIERGEVQETHDKANNIFQTTFTTSVILFALLILFIIGMQLYISKLIFPPLQKLQRAAIKMASGGLDTRVDINTQDEMAQVGASFNAMAQHLQDSYKQIEKESSDERTRVHELTEKNDLLEKTKIAMVNILEDERALEEQLKNHSEELEQANALIEEQKERAESILRYLKSIGEGVFATDEKRQIIFMNDAAELFSGKTFGQAKNQIASEIFTFVRMKPTGEEEVLQITQKVLEKKRNIILPNKLFLAMGEKRMPVSGTCSLIHDDNGDIIGTITVFQDITKKHELDQMKDSFLSVAAHQLRTPLGSMRWSMELLLGGDLGKLPKAAKEAIEQIYDNSKRMIVLVGDLLNVARMDQSKGQEEKKSTDVASLIDEVVKTMHAEAEKRGIMLVWKKPQKSPPAIMVPPKHFYEAFENLLSNGIKYNRKDGKLTVTLKEEKDGLNVTVSDTGIGIPKDAQSKIFSKFFRAQNAVLKETEGSGLGLSVVKSYLEEAGATISFESTENVGTTFFIKIPFHAVNS